MCYNKDTTKERNLTTMTTTTIIPANTLAKELGIERKDTKIIKLKNRFINQIISELKEKKVCDFVIGNNTFSFFDPADKPYLNLSREDLIKVAKELAADFEKAGYNVSEYEYASSNRKNYYSIVIEF